MRLGATARKERLCAGRPPSAAASRRRPSASRCGRAALPRSWTRVRRLARMGDVELGSRLRPRGPAAPRRRRAPARVQRPGALAAAGGTGRRLSRHGSRCRPRRTCATSPRARARRTAAIRSSARGRRACSSATSPSTRGGLDPRTPTEHIRERSSPRACRAERLQRLPPSPPIRATRPARGPRDGGRTFDVLYVGSLSVRRGCRCSSTASAASKRRSCRLVLLGGWASRGMRSLPDRRARSGILGSRCVWAISSQPAPATSTYTQSWTTASATRRQRRSRPASRRSSRRTPA